MFAILKQWNHFSIEHQEKIEVVNAQANLFAEADHFDAPSIATKKEALNERYQQLQVIKGAIGIPYCLSFFK